MSKKPVTPKPLWEGPYSKGSQGGLTQSLLQKFLVCRHRFWLKTVKGLTEDEGFSRPLEFGNLWHAMEEAYCGYRRTPYGETVKVKGKPAPGCTPDVWEKALKKYRLHLLSAYPNDVAEVEKWYNVARVTFPIYADYWSKHSDEKQRQPLLEEVSFQVPYTLPSGRVVILRGKWDAVCLLPPPRDAGAARLWKKLWPKAKLGIFVQENKTKGKIDEEGILKTVGWNLQTMMYQIALRILRERYFTDDGIEAYFTGPYEISGIEAAFKKDYPLAGVLYNVIKRPLSDQHAIKQKKGGKKLGKGKVSAPESASQFYARLAETIRADCKSNFMRWNAIVQPHEIDQFREEVFDPHLENLCNWWDSIQCNPMDPWHTHRAYDPKTKQWEGSIRNPHHWQMPFGVYNGMCDGMRGEFFEYLTSGRDYGLKQTPNLFPEL